MFRIFILTPVHMFPGEDISIFLPQFSTTEPKATAKEISKTVAINGLTPLLLKTLLDFLIVSEFIRSLNVFKDFYAPGWEIFLLLLLIPNKQMDIHSKKLCHLL